MTLMACRDETGRFTPPAMDTKPWQIRAKAAGLSQSRLARLCGKSDNTISRQMRGEFGEVPGYIMAIVIAWERMSADDRAAWAAAVERELARRESGGI